MEKLAKDLSFLNLPSTMWGIHIHPQYEFICILHINIANSKLSIDKGILLANEDGFKAKIFLNGFITHVPNIISNITSVPEISDLLDLLHNKNVCGNFVETKGSPECLKLIDNEMEDDAMYCSSCQKKYNSTVVTRNVIEPYRENDFITDHGKRHRNQSENNTNDNKKIDRNKEKEALCNFCGKLFLSGYRIEEHILTHTHEKPFQCKVCLKTFSKSHNLKMHEHTHSGVRPYTCSACGKSYTTSSNLRAHTLSSHSNEKKHVCGICEMTFLYPRYLKAHLRTHTGEKPFICLTCGKTFSKKIHLTIHMRTHTGEKPHRCDICGKGFTTTGGLGYHRRVHHKNIP